MHLFDLEKGTCEELYAFKEVHDFFKKFHQTYSIQELIHFIVGKTTTKDYLQPILEFTNFSTLNERLKDKKILSFDFVGTIHGWTRSSFIPTEYDAEGNIRKVIYTTRIIQNDKEREENLLAVTDYDERTGVYNRHAFEYDCAMIAKGGMSKFFTCLSFDINGLNEVNRTVGITAGDEMIIGAAQCIKACFGEKGKIYRIGGDEFNAFIDCNLEELTNLYGRFDTITSEWRGNLVKGLTISKGCAAHSEYPDLTIRELQAKADQRMYKEKEIFYNSKNREKSSYINDPAMFAEIMRKSYMGLVSMEFGDYSSPKMYIDDFIKAFLGFPEDYTQEQTYEEWVNRIHPDYSDSVSAAIEKIIIGNQTEVQYPWIHPKVGLLYIRSFGYRDPNYTNGVRITGFFQNVTHLLHVQKDTLTGFYTKETFFQKADEILAANPDKNYRFLLSDIENFKTLNEKYGTELSDKLLKYLAKQLKLKTPNLILSGRLSSDVLVCMQEDVGTKQSREDGLKFQKEIMKNAPIQNFVWKHGIYYTKTERNVSTEIMCSRARAAAKSIKGNYLVSCAVYDTEFDKLVKTQQQILDNMEDALKNNEFKVYLQPKYDLHSNKTGGAEALVRWIHPELGFMNPGDFIPLFETNGFVRNVDQFVFIEVCNIIRRWLDDGKPVVPISVNLSRRDFEHEDLADEIMRTVDEMKIPHNLIHLEVTESVFSDNPERIAETIRTLHRNGFVIELDDFGSGYSSITSLSEIEFDVLKLDMSIIKKDNPNSARNVLDMCSYIVRQMKLKSVAEGVENEAQLNRLKDLGCDYIQGYYFSKPLPVDEFEVYLAKEV